MDSHRNLPRRRHSAQLKREVLAACSVPGASVAGVALSFGLNANLVRQWRRGRGIKQCEGTALVETAATSGAAQERQGQPQFIALAMPPAQPISAPPAKLPEVDIRIEARRGDLQVSVNWPSSEGADCAAWLRELLR